MSPERAADLVRRWVRAYTRDLPEPVAERRAGELEADLHDHIAHERASGTPEARIAFGIAARMARGAAADLAWRGRAMASTSSTTRKDRTTMTDLSRPGARTALVTGCILLVLLVWNAVSEEMVWSAFDFVLAGVLLAGVGLLLELALRRPGVVHAVIAVAVAVAAIVAGEADDAPGLVGFGCLVLLGTMALGARTALRGR